METATSAPLQIPHFGPSTKKRKFRQRRLSTSSDTPAPAPAPAPAPVPATTTPSVTSTPDPTLNPAASSASPPPTSNSEVTDAPSLASILARRKKIRTARGLEVTAQKLPTGKKDEVAVDDQTEDEKAAAADAELQAVVNRFTHQTGQILDVDKHMMAFIEAEMNKRRGTPINASTSAFTSANAQTEKDGNGNGNGSSAFGGRGGNGAYWAPKRPEARGATLGKLHEVDLGEESKMRNIVRTQEATRRLEIGEEVDEGKKKNGKRRRRNSQDIQRDKLVEEVLKESRLEMYTDPEPTGQEDVEGAADDRIAEKFRREFLDALSSRRRRRGGDHRHKKKDDSKRPKGPKLGGSRMARAAMRESQAQASGSGKK